MNKTEKVLQHRAGRQDSEEAFEKAKKFISWLMRDFHRPTKIRAVKCKYAAANNLYYDESTTMTCELIYDEEESFQSKWDIPQVLDKNHNTRKILPTELHYEADSQDGFKAVGEVILALMEHEIHFAVFYAAGQRSPHIVIYDMFELEELSEYQRVEAQKQFWKKIAPLFWKHADSGLWLTGHTCPLEFRPHWKYGTIFDLVFEYIPKKKEERQCNLWE